MGTKPQCRTTLLGKLLNDVERKNSGFKWVRLLRGLEFNLPTSITNNLWKVMIIIDSGTYTPKIKDGVLTPMLVYRNRESIFYDIPTQISDLHVSPSTVLYMLEIGMYLPFVPFYDLPEDEVYDFVKSHPNPSVSDDGVICGTTVTAVNFKQRWPHV